jgi:hydroxypyruvate reductase
MLSSDRFRHDIQVIVRAAIAAVSPRVLVARALGMPAIRQFVIGRPFHLLAVGKAAAPMASAWLQHGLRPEHGLVVGTVRGRAALDSLVWREGGHPIPDERSVAAAQEAMTLGQSVAAAECLVVLLSGGASALMALPLGHLTISDKQTAVSALLKAGADITALNTVRKHLSRVKGGRLAAACQGSTLTLAISDVVGDDPGVIGSGPTVADSTTFADAQQAIDTLDVAARLPESVRSAIEAGARGDLEESIKPGDPRLRRSEWHMLGGRRHAMAGAKEAADALGYKTMVIEEPVIGEASDSARGHVQRLRALGQSMSGRVCVISSGETTVKVTGEGVGGRNQEFILAAATALSDLPPGSTIASVGTDGVDGPTDAAGALADSWTLTRAAEVGLADPATYVARNDSYRFFERLGDLIITGPTDTNVGDLQVALIP